jgi:hypothetical protein
MARQTKDTERNGSFVQQSAQAVTGVIQTGASAVGRGVSAGVEGMAQLATRAAEMTGITSPDEATPERKVGRIAQRRSSRQTSRRSSARSGNAAKRRAAASNKGARTRRTKGRTAKRRNTKRARASKRR